MTAGSSIQGMAFWVHRLAIMGLTPLGMQPFHLDGSYVVCNGEIYGFEQLKKELEPKYTFSKRFRL